MVGYNNIRTVYNIMANTSQFVEKQNNGWHYCVLSKVNHENCYVLGTDVNVAQIYKSWIYAVWLITHILMLEKLRKTCKLPDNVLEEHFRVYQKSMLLVVQSLLDAYPTIVYRAQCVAQQVLEWTK
tara:strand:- start:151 stop:528 length:378 start_codon:yes stop_codon:yes gene_type:complete